MTLRGKFSVGFISGLLTVVGHHEANGRYYWCDCECGNKRVLVPQRVLDRGFTKKQFQASCGSACAINPYRFNDMTDEDREKLRHAEAKLAAKRPVDY